MNPEIFPSHVAILVPSVRRAADYLRRFDIGIGEEEVWEGKGTREIYGSEEITQQEPNEKSNE